MLRTPVSARDGDGLRPGKLVISSFVASGKFTGDEGFVVPVFSKTPRVEFEPGRTTEGVEAPDKL